MVILWSEIVRARRYFYPGCHRMEPYRSYFPHAGLLLPETERLAARVLVLPTGTAVGSSEIRTICEIVRLAAVRGGQITERLARGSDDVGAARGRVRRCISRW
jgi:dTDP-4-amino-4,6-dideoxygalactose transaminase